MILDSRGADWLWVWWLSMCSMYLYICWCSSIYFYSLIMGQQNNEIDGISFSLFSVISPSCSLASCLNTVFFALDELDLTSRLRVFYRSNFCFFLCWHNNWLFLFVTNLRVPPIVLLNFLILLDWSYLSFLSRSRNISKNSLIDLSQIVHLLIIFNIIKLLIMTCSFWWQKVKSIEFSSSLVFARLLACSLQTGVPVSVVDQTGHRKRMTPIECLRPSQLADISLGNSPLRMRSNHRGSILAFALYWKLLFHTNQSQQFRNCCFAFNACRSFRWWMHSAAKSGVRSRLASLDISHHVEKSCTRGCSRWSLPPPNKITTTNDNNSNNNENNSMIMIQINRTLKIRENWRKRVRQQ